MDIINCIVVVIQKTCAVDSLNDKKFLSVLLFVCVATARVFEHQIPGGQYSNLLVQCQVDRISQSTTTISTILM